MLSSYAIKFVSLTFFFLHLYTYHIIFTFIYCTCSYTFHVLYFVLSIYCHIQFFVLFIYFHVLCTFHILSYFIYYRYLHTFSGGAISWQSKLQKCVSLSTIEAEDIVAIKAGKEMLWMKRFLQELDLSQRDYIVHCNSQSVINFSKNTMYHARTKHTDVRYHWTRKAIREQLFQIRKIHIDKNTVDMMTKSLQKKQMARCIKNAGMSSY